MGIEPATWVRFGSVSLIVRFCSGLVGATVRVRSVRFGYSLAFRFGSGSDSVGFQVQLRLLPEFWFNHKQRTTGNFVTCSYNVVTSNHFK